MKTSCSTQTSNQQRKPYPTSSIGLAFSDGVANLDSTAERIKNCLVVTEDIHVEPLTFVLPGGLELAVSR
jgi:hypothetical protein